MNNAFVEQFKATQELAHEINVANGWWDERREMRYLLVDDAFSRESLDAMIGIHLIGLIHTELSEAVEAFRKPANALASIAPHSVARELAGTIVQIMNMSQEMGIPVGAAIVAEIEHNAGRGRMHGGNVA